MAITQFTNRQVLDGTIVIADLSATGTPSSSTYLRGDNTWATVTASTPDTLLTKNVLSADTIITAGYSAYIPMFLEMATGFKMEVGLGSYLEIG